MKNLSRITKAIIAVLICEMAGFIGSVFTMQSVSTWYPMLQKPFFNPPNWLFSPVWITLYAMMGISAYLIFEKGHKNPKVRKALLVFLIQLLLNTLWSFLFFGLKSPFYGLVGIILLLVAITSTMEMFYPINRTAFYMLVPYACWVIFATILNFALFILN